MRPYRLIFYFFKCYLDRVQYLLCHSQLCSQMTYLLSCCNIRLFLVQNSFSSLILILSMIFRNSQQ